MEWGTQKRNSKWGHKVRISAWLFHSFHESPESSYRPELCSQVDFWEVKATICSLYPGATQLPSVSWTEVHQRPAVKRQQDGQLPWISAACLASWHLAALPLPQVNCWESPPWKLLTLPTSAAALLSLCCSNTLPPYTLEVKWSLSYTWLYLWDHLGSNVNVSFPPYTPPRVKAELPRPPWTWLLGNTQPCEFVTSVWRKFQFHLQL